MPFIFLFLYFLALIYFSTKIYSFFNFGSLFQSLEMNSKSIRFSREAGMEIQKRNITDTETPVLEKVALEEQLKDMKLDLEDNGNGSIKKYMRVIS